MRRLHYWILAAWLLTRLGLSAHNTGLSVLNLEFGGREPRATFILAAADADHLYAFDKDSNGDISAEEFRKGAPGFAQYLQESLHLRSEGREMGFKDLTLRQTDATTIEASWKFNPEGRHLSVRNDTLESLPETHRLFIFLLRGRESFASASLDRQNPEKDFELDLTIRPQHSWSEFFHHGMFHIFTGWDHLLFLFALLMAGGRSSTFIKIITAFTVTHSVSLALAVLGFFTISPRIIEPLIAFSIVFVAVENMVWKKESHRWKLAAFFGFIHGFGFASAAFELFAGQTRAALIWPLALFNIGIETGQLAIATVIVPVLWQFKDRTIYQKRLLPIGSALVALAGAYWMVERLAEIWRR